MSYGIHLEIHMDPSFKKLVEGLRPTVIRGAVYRGMVRSLPQLHAVISKEHLSGKGPFPVELNRLGVRSGHGRRSFYYTQAEASTSTSQVNGGSLGIPVTYMAAHEFGFAGVVNVPAHQRRRPKTGRGKRKKRKDGMVSVRPYQVQLVIPERRPVRAGIEKNAELMTDEILNEVESLMSA